jgi:hypothetical protein
MNAASTPAQEDDMPVGTAAYSEDELPSDHQEALLDAIDELTDEFFDDVAELLDEGDFAETTMGSFLPPRYLPRYTPVFAKQFLVCLLTVAWKIRAPGAYGLACTAEALALDALIQTAESAMEAAGQRYDFDAFRDVAYEDEDYRLLFDPARDGIETTAAGRNLALANLEFSDWFRPFREKEPVHPYAEGGAGLADDGYGRGAGR